MPLRGEKMPAYSSLRMLSYPEMVAKMLQSFFLNRPNRLLEILISRRGPGLDVLHLRQKIKERREYDFS
jgi:hypothetical protein